MIYVSHLLEDDTMRELLQKIPVGVESIDFSIAYNLDHFEETLRMYRDRLENMGWDPSLEDGLMIHGPFLDINPAAFDSEVAKVTRMRYEQAYRAARALGAKRIVYHSCHVPSIYMQEVWAPRVSAFYQQFLEDKPDDIEVLMENVYDPVPELMWECAEAIAHPAFGLCLDVGHAHCFSEVPMKRWVEECGPYVKHIHVHDNRRNKDSHLAAGDGNLPWETVLPLLKKGFSCTIECNTADDVEKTYAFLTENING